MQVVTTKPAVTQSKPSTSTSIFKCYKCREAGHRASECKKGDCLGKNLFIEAEEEAEEQNGEFDLILGFHLFILHLLGAYLHLFEVNGVFL